MKKQAIIAMGNTFTGFVFYGPFEDKGEAENWALKWVSKNHPWVVQSLKDPTEYDPNGKIDPRKNNS